MTDRPKPTRQILEEALFQNPDDRVTQAAYADLLQEEGDPRGEFIHTQLALKDKPVPTSMREPLKQREAELLAAHGDEWLGELAPFLGPASLRDPTCSFARGWLDDLRVSELSVELARVLVRAPIARLLRSLAVRDLTSYDRRRRYGLTWYEEGDDVPQGAEMPGLYALRRAPWMAHLRTFHLGSDDRFDVCRTSGAAAAEFVAHAPRLEELFLLAHEVDCDRLFRLPLPHLRVLLVYHLDHYPVELLALNPTLTRLERLELHPHALRSGDEDLYLRMDQLRAITRSQHLASLRHLEFALSDVGDAGCAEIVRSGLLKRLKVLDVCLGTITDAGARILAESPDFKNLEYLDISSNSLSNEGIALLEATGVKIEASTQHDVDENRPNDFGEWVSEGDWE
jgi:uncharacterized protein (TIGR02996 family)